MHSTIFELQPNNVRKENWATELNFTDNHNIDYCTKLSGDKREERVELLYSLGWFKELFYTGSKKDTIVFRGKDCLTAYKQKWYREIQKELTDMIFNHSCETWKLQYAIDKNSEVDSMFCIPKWCGDEAVFMKDLLTYLEEFEGETTFYICGVFDFHY